MLQNKIDIIFYKIEAKYFSIALVTLQYFNNKFVNPPAGEAGKKPFYATLHVLIGILV